MTSSAVEGLAAFGFLVSLIMFVVSVVVLIVFFVMASNIGGIARYNRKQVEQNAEIIDLLKKLNKV